MNIYNRFRLYIKYLVNKWIIYEECENMRPWHLGAGTIASCLYGLRRITKYLSQGSRYACLKHEAEGVITGPGRIN
jgi:hypothetical protein